MAAPLFLPRRKRFKAALDFTGSANAARIHRSTSLISATDPRPVTFGVWAKKTAATKQGFIFSNSGGSSPTCAVSIDSSGNMRLFSGAYATSTAASAVIGEWAYYAWTWAPDNTVTFYTNGKRISTVTRAAGGTSAQGCGFNDLGGGSAGFNAGSWGFDGALSDFACWNAVLTDREIDLLSSGVPPQSVRAASLVAYHPMARPVTYGEGATDWVSTATVPNEAAPPSQIKPWAQRFVNLEASGGTSHTLAGANCSQANASSTGAVVQRHQLGGSGATQANTSSTGAASSRHVLAGSTSSQPNASSTGAIDQRHSLAGTETTQGNTSSAATITQHHQLAGAATTQANTCSTAALGQQPHILAGSTSSQANASTSGAIVQRHLLAGAACVQAGVSGVGAVRQRHQLQGAACVQASLSPGGALEGPAPPAEMFMPSALRTFRFAAENRRFVFAPENRTIKFNA